MRNDATTLICHLGKVAQEFGSLAMRAVLMGQAYFGGVVLDSKSQAALTDPKVTKQGPPRLVLPMYVIVLNGSVSW
jgi:hypothetical protein